ncbi:uncharacterized protein LOC121737220 [Aricia agestis]|uniref:uncharacterized protein LOC121737220 n=1 Tax=Aricia agestis TaxID=91739 RepID=UPI001C202BBC|nr:uncharacterized protein LOC121737220 [Aricia agestis]
MLPSMPILFTRESQDAFGNKIEPSTSFFNPTSTAKPAIAIEGASRKTLQNGQTSLQNKDTTQKSGEEIKKNDAETKTKVEDNPLEAALVRGYYTKIQNKFSAYASQPTNKFRQFREALKTFDPNKETPVDLYKKIEQIFGSEHKDLVEEFLLFLKPGQAVEVGRFMDHFMLVQITGFIKLLNTTFSRKPTVLRKIIRAISNGMNTGGSAEMRGRVLPHLRSSPRLLQMFQSLFPDTRPPDIVYEGSTDTINESFLTEDQGYDVWEFAEDKHNKRKPSAKEGLNSEYLHGRVFIQHGRMLRTACVTYPYSKEPYRSHARRLAPGSLSPSDDDRERGSPKKNNKIVDKIPPKRTRKQTKSPTKNVKDFNDNTKKDLTNTLNKIKGKTHAKAKVYKKDEQKKKDNKSTRGADKIEAKVEKNWTRDEDKTMLEILKGESGSEEVFERIRAVLPHRTISEIKERLHHVLNLLQEMAVNIT